MRGLAAPLAALLGFLAAAPLAASEWPRLACFERPATRDPALPETLLRAVGPVALRVVAGPIELLCFDGSARTAEEIGRRLSGAGLAPTRSWSGIDRERLVVLRGVRRPEAERLGRVLASAGRSALVELAPERSLEALVHPSHAPEREPFGDLRSRPLAEEVGREVVLERLEPAPASGPVTPALDFLVAEVDAARWFAAVTTLAGWNRWTRGTEVLSARDWLVARFEEVRGAEVWTESFPVTGSTGWNVFARMRGTTEPATWYLVGGHYDATSENPALAAPGAEDNASGCAGVLELARCFAETPPPRTLLFVCYSGEEQGLYGSTDHASDLVASGGDAGFGGALIFDMIGYDGDQTLDVLLETGAIGQPLIDLFAAAAGDYAGLVVSSSLDPFGSDHVPYLQRGLPALLAIENDWDIYPHYHRTTDLPENLSLPMGEGILRMGAAGVGRLAGLADLPGLLFRDGFERGDATAWLQGTDP